MRVDKDNTSGYDRTSTRPSSRAMADEDFTGKRQPDEEKETRVKSRGWAKLAQYEEPARAHSQMLIVDYFQAMMSDLATSLPGLASGRDPPRAMVSTSASDHRTLPSWS